mmetsp:Transcript_14119/g.19229  ORF Transcript_14119/g.19229 Transcript_14119/m.19229 type:complete len:98 (+) Transcript_14119:727-1020(+)
MASVTVFKTQMKIFEKKIMSDRAHEMAKVSTASLLERRDEVFARPMPSSPSDSNKMNLSIEAASNMKMTLQANINRIDLLTDAKIGDIKNLMKTMTD